MIDKDLYSQHKLLKHLDRLLEFNEKGFTYPIFTDFNLTNKCNNKCPLCVSSESRDNTSVTLKDAKRVIRELKDVGVKAVYFAGGGDPSCHPNLEEIIRFTKDNNTEVAVCTNSYQLSEGVMDSIIECCSWMRVSLDADSPEIYKRTHGMDNDAFNRVISNMKKLVEKKNKSKSDTIIGVTYLIGQATIKGIYNAAKLCKEIGVDYIRFRPFFEWMDKEKIQASSREILKDELKKCEKLNDQVFSASYPKEKIESIIKESSNRNERCYVPHILTAITADLKLYPCCVLRNNKKYCLGDLKEQSFKEMWNSEKRKDVHNLINLVDCPKPCQYEKHNNLLNIIKNELIHSNFL